MINKLCSFQVLINIDLLILQINVFDCYKHYYVLGFGMIYLLFIKANILNLIYFEIKYKKNNINKLSLSKAFYYIKNNRKI